MNSSPDAELDGRLDAQEDAVAGLEVVEPEAPVAEADRRLARMAEALAGQDDGARRADDRLGARGLVDAGPPPRLRTTFRRK